MQLVLNGLLLVVSESGWRGSWEHVLCTYALLYTVSSSLLLKIYAQQFIFVYARCASFYYRHGPLMSALQSLHGTARKTSNLQHHRQNKVVRKGDL